MTGSWGDRVKAKPGVEMSFASRQFDPDTGFSYAPEDRRRATVLATMTVWRPSFEHVRYYQSLGRVEDAQTGSWAQAWVGGAGSAFGSDRSYGVMGARVVPRIGAGPGRYLFGSFGFSGRVSGGDVVGKTCLGQYDGSLEDSGDTRLRSQSKVGRRLANRRPHTTAAGTRAGTS